MKTPIAHKLNQFFATAICGNDILSSTLYVSGIAIFFAGAYAPLVLLFVSLILYCYKLVFTEVVEALPSNGGVYTSLLNSTSKTIAAIGGVTTLLSYVCTAAISAKVGADYLNYIYPSVPPILGAIIVLFIFALLVIAGITTSSRIASVFFVVHIITLIAVLIYGLISYLNGHSYFAENLAFTSHILESHGGLFLGIYLAFSASLLSVSGFESSANYVEEQAPGVFRKTLRNMLIAVTIFNPLIALVALNSLPFEAITGAQNFLLADVANSIGGNLLKILVGIDATLVLAGAVHTSYVGVNGLLSRMTYDSCLPSYFAKSNSKGVHPRIIVFFFLICSAIPLFTQGDLLSLAGAYTIAFLLALTLFGVSNLLLRQSRSELKRSYRAPLYAVGFATIATIFGIIGNIRISPQNLTFFEIYFIPGVTIVLLFVYQDQLVKALVRYTDNLSFLKSFNNYLRKNFRDLTEGKFVIFIHHAERLYKILNYLSRNETGWDITLVNCKDSDQSQNLEFEKIKNILPILQEVGVFPHFKYTLSYVDKPFGPAVIDEVSQELGIRKNRMMIGTIHDRHHFTYEELGGVRIIY